MIQISKPMCGNEELKLVGKVFESDWLGMGKEVYTFENLVKEYIGTENVIATNTGTSAIHLALIGLEIKKGDEVIVPSLTFAGTVQPILACGAKPVFCEVEENTLNVDVDDLYKKITQKTRAIIPVHYGGLSCDMDGISECIGKKRIAIVEDAAHAFGSTYKRRKIGSFGDVTCFSFDPIKVITCGEGGAVCTNNNKLASKIRESRILGITKDTWTRYKNVRTWDYDVARQGFRYHMSNINAAIGIAQFNKFDSFVKRRKKIVERYDELLRDVNGVTLLTRNYKETVPFNYVIKVEGDRDKLMKYLKDNGVLSGIQYIPNHLHSFFKKYKSRLPKTEAVWKKILALPLYYELKNEEIYRVVSLIKKYYGEK